MIERDRADGNGRRVGERVLVHDTDAIGGPGSGDEGHAAVTVGVGVLTLGHRGEGVHAAAGEDFKHGVQGAAEGVE